MGSGEGLRPSLPVLAPDRGHTAMGKEKARDRFILTSRFGKCERCVFLGKPNAFWCMPNGDGWSGGKKPQGGRERGAYERLEHELQTVCSGHWLYVDHASHTPRQQQPALQHATPFTPAWSTIPCSLNKQATTPSPFAPHIHPTPSTPAGQLAIDRDMPRQLHGLAGRYLARQRVEQRRLATAAGTPTNSNWWRW